MQEGFRKIGDTETLKTIVSPDVELSIRRQCELLNLCRSNLYYAPIGESEDNLKYMELMDKEHTEHPTKGVMGMVLMLRDLGFIIGPKRIRRLLRKMNLRAIYPGKSLTKPGNCRYIHSYLLRHLDITHSNHVWSIDITYIPMKKGFLYLTAIIDVYSRYIVGWGISNTLDGENSLNVLKEAIAQHGKPEIVNSDQGVQFTCSGWVDYLKEQGIQISMDGKGRALDNIYIERFWRTIKQEYIYLNPVNDGVELYNGVKKYMEYYSRKRQHSGIGGYKPIDWYENAA